MTKPYNHDTVSFALGRAQERGDIISWSSGTTGHARARTFYDVTAHFIGSQKNLRLSLSEAHAFLAGIGTMRHKPLSD